MREEKWGWTDIKMDISERSILGLLLYEICVNNLPESVEPCQVKQYAGGTAMFHSADSVSEVLEKDLDSVARWVDCF